MAHITDLSAGTWTVDAAHSELGFTARHLMVTKVRGKFNEFEATATVADDVTASSINAVVQLASVDTGSPTATRTSGPATSSTSRTTRP